MSDIMLLEERLPAPAVSLLGTPGALVAIDWDARDPPDLHFRWVNGKESCMFWTQAGKSDIQVQV